MAFRTICLVLFLLGAVPLSAVAQPNPEVANCEAIKDPDTEFQAQVCSAHIACGFVMGVQRTCTKVKSFLRNLGTAVQNAGKRLTGSKDINAEDVFEALIEPVHRQIDKDPKVKSISDRTKAATKDVANAEPKVLTKNGLRELFYGDPSGQTSRSYYVFGDDGNAGRGGLGKSEEREAIGANGVRRVGNRSEGTWDGPGGYVDETGLVLTGTFSRGFFGEGTRTNPDGTKEVGRFGREGNFTMLSEGQKFDRNGTLMARGKFANGKLMEGEQRDSSGRMVAVGAQPAQQAALPPQNVQQPQKPQQAVAQNSPSVPGRQRNCQLDENLFSQLLDAQREVHRIRGRDIPKEESRQSYLKDIIPADRSSPAQYEQQISEAERRPNLSPEDRAQNRIEILYPRMMLAYARCKQG